MKGTGLGTVMNLIFFYRLFLINRIFFDSKQQRKYMKGKKATKVGSSEQQLLWT